MAKERIFNLPETKGAFQLKGIVTGTKKDGFSKSLKTKTNKDMNIVNFGVEYDEGKTLFVNLQGTETDNVYFSKKAEKKGDKPETVAVPWVNRFTYNREGFKLIGKNIGVTKKLDEKGNEVNDKKVLTDFDACKEVAEHLKDEKSVFIRGKIDYSSSTDDKGNTKHYTKLVPDQISLCSPVDFEDDKFESQNDFNQVIIFKRIEKEKVDDKETGRAIVSALIVTYKTIENVEFIMTDTKLMSLFRKNLKPYYALQVSGHIISEVSTEEVVNEDSWGEEDAMSKVKAPAKREFVITGAKPSTIEKKLYSQVKVEEALEKIRKANKAEEDFNSSSDEDWGDVSDDDDEAWD